MGQRDADQEGAVVAREESVPHGGQREGRQRTEAARKAPVGEMPQPQGRLDVPRLDVGLGRRGELRNGERGGRVSIESGNSRATDREVKSFAAWNRESVTRAHNAGMRRLYFDVFRR